MKTEFYGLTPAQVEESRRLHGSNLLTPAARRSAWSLFFEKFRDPLIVILLVAGFLSVGISCYEYYLGGDPSVFFEPVGIFMAIILATTLAFVFERRADREFAVLSRVNDDEPVAVVRQGNVTETPRRDIVVGDIVILSTGCEVPADGKLLDATSLKVDESSLTGEPSCSKTVDPAHFDPDATFPSNVVMRGTKVMEGHGVMEVTAVGDATENGRVTEAAHIDSSVRTPLDDQLARLGRLISISSYIIGALIIVARMAMYFVNADFQWMSFLTRLLQSVMIAVTLVVVSVPEGLPMAVTLALAYSMRRMLKTNNLVRRLHACETMGATTVICTDKTGTLTENRMQVAHADFFGDPPVSVIARGIAVNSTAGLDRASQPHKVIGNPTEGALLLWLERQGVDYRELRQQCVRVSELPFSTERKYMATVVENPAGGRILYVKGAPEIVFAMCRVVSGVTRSELDALLLRYQSQAMRTLGFAWQRLAPGEPDPISSGGVNPSALSFLGITAISDPVRADVPDAVHQVRSAGIDVKVVTGDTPATAMEIGREIGLWSDSVDSDSNIATGPEVAAMSDSELTGCVDRLKIIARARPLDKKRLVEALQRRGEVVAVTGDGTNDAPALKTAHVGLSMGDGTSVAKEASDITIIDNSFSSIGRAVMWGRSLYRNIQRFILFQMTVNVAACLIVLIGSFMGMQSPLTVTQMLWVNLIMDTFAAMALASLPPTSAVMHDKPRSRSAFIISPSMSRFIIGVGLAMSAVLLALLWYLEHSSVTSVSMIGRAVTGAAKEMTPYEMSVFFTVFVFMQFWNMFNARAFATGRSAFHFRGCGGFLFIAALIFAGQILIVQFGGPFFNVTPLSLSDWLLIIATTSLVLWLGELSRLHHP